MTLARRRREKARAVNASRRGGGAGLVGRPGEAVVAAGGREEIGSERSSMSSGRSGRQGGRAGKRGCEGRAARRRTRSFGEETTARVARRCGERGGRGRADRAVGGVAREEAEEGSRGGDEKRVERGRVEEGAGRGESGSRRGLFDDPKMRESEKGRERKAPPIGVYTAGRPRTRTPPGTVGGDYNFGIESMKSDYCLRSQS